MLSKIIFILALAATLIFAACTPTQNFNVDSTGFSSRINAERASRGLSPLGGSVMLNAAAQAHADEMAKNNIFSHTGSTGTTPSDRAKAQGYSFCFIAENIAKGQPDEQQVFAAWMDSAGHRKNILSRSATQFGIARADGNYWVLMLGRPCA